MLRRFGLGEVRVLGEKRDLVAIGQTQFAIARLAFEVEAVMKYRRFLIIKLLQWLHLSVRSTRSNRTEIGIAFSLIGRERNRVLPMTPGTASDDTDDRCLPSTCLAALGFSAALAATIRGNRGPARRVRAPHCGQAWRNRSGC